MICDGASTEEELAVLGFLAGYRGETVRAYASDLRWWSRWCAKAEVDMLGVTRAHLEGYSAAMQDELGLSPATVARRLTTVCGFYRHCTADGLLARNPGEFVRRPAVPRGEHHTGPDLSGVRRVPACRELPWPQRAGVGQSARDARAAGLRGLPHRHRAPR